MKDHSESGNQFLPAARKFSELEPLNFAELAEILGGTADKDNPPPQKGTTGQAFICICW